MSQSGKRVGASVAVPAEQQVGPPINPAFPVYSPFVPPGCGYGPFVRPPPCIVDNRHDHHHHHRRRDDGDVIISGSILPGQVVPGGSTQQVALSTLNFSSGGGSLSGSTLMLPRRGIYQINLTVIVTRDASSAPGTVLFSNGGGITIAGGTLQSGETQVFTGSILVQGVGRNTPISIVVSNSTSGTGPISIMGGTITAQLLSEDRD